MLEAWRLESPPEGMLPGGEEGDVKHIEGVKSSCWALEAQTCDCCLYLEEQKGIDVVKGRRQSWLKYSVDSCSGGDSAHCGGPACDVSGEGSCGEGRPAGHAFGILQSGSDGDNLDSQYSLFGNSTSRTITNVANANSLDAVIQTNSFFPGDAPQDQQSGFLSSNLLVVWVCKTVKVSRKLSA